MLCAIYTRLSKEDEEKRGDESESIQNQKNLLTKYALDHGWDIYAIYCDEDYSGIDSMRPDFNRMIDAAKQNRFQIILCKTQSRFTRDMELVEKYIHGLFPILGIRFVAVADNVDTDVKGNKKARQINGLINEWYLEDLSENIRMVFDMKRRQGQYIGGFPIYGYKLDPNDKHKLMIDEEAAHIVRKIYQLLLDGHGKQEIAHILNDCGIPSPSQYKIEHGIKFRPPTSKTFEMWNKTTVWRILRNEMYTGVMVQGKTKKISYKSKAILPVPEDQWFRVEGTHEPIIDRQTFDTVQKMMNLRAVSSGHGPAHVLSGLVHCMDCGAAMTKSTSIRKNGVRDAYLRCRVYAESGSSKKCTRHGVRLDALIHIVAERIKRYVDEYFNVEDLDLHPRKNDRASVLEKEYGSTRAQMDKISSAIKGLYMDKIAGLISDAQFADLNQSFLEDKEKLDRRIRAIQAELEEVRNPEGAEEMLEKAKELLTLDPLPRELVVCLIKDILIGEKDPESGTQEIKIIWKF